jgi:hypothetical protein
MTEHTKETKELQMTEILKSSSYANQTSNNSSDTDSLLAPSEDKQNSYVANKFTKADWIQEIARGLQLFHDQNKDPYCVLDGQCIRLNDKRVNQYIARDYYLSSGFIMGAADLNDYLNLLKGLSLFDSPQFTLHNRIACHDGCFWYDLGDHRAIRITESGWQLVDAPILFRRYSHQSVQITPVSGGDVRGVFCFLSITTDNQLLTLVLMISCLVPDIAHPIFHPHGAQGGGKTSMFLIMKRLIDPSSLEIIISPKDKSELIRQINRHHLPLFDNMSKIDGEMSDILCNACTGGGIAKRQLYTDDEDIIYNFKRCIGINGINLLISRPDLLDRTILLHLDRIDPEHRRDEAEMWQEFDKVKANILGGMFDILARAMAILPTIKLRNLPRLADFARWGYAIAEAIGKGLGEEFLEAYQKNINRQHAEIIQDNTLCLALVRFMEDRSVWEGLISEAYTCLYNAAGMPDKSDPTFPKNAKWLRRHLERIKATLIDSEGITYSIGNRTEHGIPITFRKEECRRKTCTGITAFTGEPSLAVLLHEDEAEHKGSSTEPSTVEIANDIKSHVQDEDAVDKIEYVYDDVDCSPIIYEDNDI